jgi:hypothetical protein
MDRTISKRTSTNARNAEQRVEPAEPLNAGMNDRGREHWIRQVSREKSNLGSQRFQGGSKPLAFLFVSSHQVEAGGWAA